MTLLPGMWLSIVVQPPGVWKSSLKTPLRWILYRVRFFRIPRIIDDFGLAPLAESVRRDLLEILDDRYDRRSTLITSQIPVEQWNAYLQDPMIADAILDRLIHNSYRLTLKGESMRKQKTALAAGATKVR